MRVIINEEVTPYLNLESLVPNKWYLFRNNAGDMIGYPSGGSNIFLAYIFDDQMTTFFKNHPKADCRFTQAKEIKAITIEV